MILFALAFVFGAFFLQQLSSLPSLYWCCWLIPLAFAGFKFRYAACSVRQWLRLSLLVAAGFLLGFLWALAFATVRLSDALPHAWENKPIELVGVVASVPELTERGERFHFDVEKIFTDGAVVPRHITLSFYPPDSWGETPLSVHEAQFRAGERWQLTVRLKRPHSTQNPHGFDFESLALSENIRATGSIKAKANNKKLQNFVLKPGYVVEHVRSVIKQRIKHVLVDKPYAGVIQALVMGDDSEIAVV